MVVAGNSADRKGRLSAVPFTRSMLNLRKPMRKGLAVKLMVLSAALCGMTLLQGCEDGGGSSAIGSAWTPAGFPWTMFNYAVLPGGAVNSGQGAAAPASGGSTVAGAIASAGGGNQVSGGTAGY